MAFVGGGFRLGHPASLYLLHPCSRDQRESRLKPLPRSAGLAHLANAQFELFLGEVVDIDHPPPCRLGRLQALTLLAIGYIILTGYTSINALVTF